MTTLAIQPFQMPAALIGPTNPLPSLQPYGNPSSAALPPGAERDVKPNYPDRGNENVFLPYRMQDGYTATRAPHAFRSAVLENDKLRATFLLEMGGRLWSLYDKVAKRELLFVNPVFQPRNLAIRDAWYTGGVEWNIGLFGHCVLTCEPWFAARAVADDGSPILRIYEWERIRRTPVQVDFHLPPGSSQLWSRVRIVNPNDHAVPMYWWSNIAVNEHLGARVIGPAEAAFSHNYSGAIAATDFPVVDGRDVTYTTSSKDAHDFYFRIPEGHRPWISHIHRDGKGIVHASTNRLYGRKLWNWGTGAGSLHWQKWLSGDSDEKYLEIQAGLCTTQSDYAIMNANETWEWAEALGPIQVDPKMAHGPWTSAWQGVEKVLDAVIPQDSLDAFLESSQAAADAAPVEILHAASGWGALEAERRKLAKEPAQSYPSIPFAPSTLGDEQEPWMALLQDGELPYRAPGEDPGSLMVQPQWQELLEQSVAAGRGQHWLSWYQLGVMRYRNNDQEGAKVAWRESVRLEPSAWALRNLAEAARADKDDALAAELMLSAVRVGPELIPVTTECCSALLRAKRPADVIGLVDGAPASVRTNSRVQMLRARAALDLGRLDEVASFFAGNPRIHNMRENEVSLTKLWFNWQVALMAQAQGVPVTKEFARKAIKQIEPPSDFDFRLRAIPEDAV